MWVGEGVGNIRVGLWGVGCVCRSSRLGQRGRRRWEKFLDDRAQKVYDCTLNCTLYKYSTILYLSTEGLDGSMGAVGSSARERGSFHIRKHVPKL